MTYRSDIAFTPAVKREQRKRGSRDGYERMARRRDFHGAITSELAAFIAQRDSIYLGTASADGRPYIQHRGGPKGFIKVLDEHRVAFADYAGNRQYITLGNLAENDRAFLFLMDYPSRKRVKMWGRAEFVEDDIDLLTLVADPDYGADVERAIVFHVEAWDVNCRQHITPRYTVEEFGAMAA